MFTSALILFREAIEIAMILGLVLAATRGLPRRGLWVIGGALLGIAGASLIAVFAETISNAVSGMGQEFFNAMILFTAAIVIGWTAVWIRKNARHMAMHFRQAGHDIKAGSMPLYSLSLIVALALLREGSEIVLFLYGMSLSGQSWSSIAIGSALGLSAGMICGILLYYGLLKIPAKNMLKVTSWLLILLVAGLSSQGVNYLSAAGYFSTLSAPLWDSSWLLQDSSIIGKTLHTLIGYSAKPTEIQLFVYLGSIVLLVSLMTRIEKNHAKAQLS